MEVKLMTFDWDKITRPIQGSLWAHDHDHSQAPEIDILQLESFFSAASDRSGGGKVGLPRDAPTIIPGTFQPRSDTRSLQFALPSEVERLLPLKEPTTAVNGEERGVLPVEAFSGVQKIYLWLKNQLSALRNRPSSSIRVAYSEATSSNAYSSDYTEPEDYASSNNNMGGMDFPDYFLSQDRDFTENNVVNNDLHEFNTQPENTAANLDSGLSEQQELADVKESAPSSTPMPNKKESAPPPSKGNSASRFSHCSPTPPIPPRQGTKALHWGKVTRPKVGRLWAFRNADISDYVEPENDDSSNDNTGGLDFPDDLLSQASDVHSSPSQRRDSEGNNAVNDNLYEFNTQSENTAANLDSGLSEPQARADVIESASSSTLCPASFHYTTNSTTLSHSTPPPPINGDLKHIPPPAPPPRLANSLRPSPTPPPPPPLKKGNSTSPFTPPRPSTIALDWNKVPKHSIQGTLWGGEHSHSVTPEIDISQLESLFPAATDRSGGGEVGVRRGVSIKKTEIVQLIDLRRARNCEIILANIKIPFPDMMDAVLKFDSSVLDIDRVENLIKCCPTKEEMKLLENYNGDRAKLGKCEKFFLELMKVPRVKSKLQVFAYKITFSSKVNELKRNLELIDVASKEIQESLKLRQIMFTILHVGNALNQGTARGSAVGFKLDSLLKLSETRARNSKMTLMHYLCKLLADKTPELLDFDKDLYHLGAASKIQLKSLTEEIQAVSNDFEKVEQEFSASENDGAKSEGFRKTLKNFLDTSESEVWYLTKLYAEVGRTADSLFRYFGEDPAKCSFERVTEILHDFVSKFRKSREENAQQAEADRKKLEKEKNAAVVTGAKKYGGLYISR